MTRRDPDGMEARARAAIAAAASPASIANARWAGLRGREPRAIELVEAFGFEDGGGLAILAATPADGDVLHLTLPLSDAPPWAGLHGLVARGGTVDGIRGGRLDGRPGSVAGAALAGGDTRGEPPAIRALPGDQSHTNVVVDERSMLKLYRRLYPGPNPEAEVLEALSGVAAAPVPAWVGSADLVLPGGEAISVAIEQAFIGDAPDAFETLADGLGAWLAGAAGTVSTEIPRGTGLATGRLHAVLGGLDRPGFVAREASQQDRTSWFEAAEATFHAAVRAVSPVDAGLAARIDGAGAAIRDALRPVGDPGISLRLQRIHGDLHLGQVLSTSGGVLLVDFEGDPTREPADRRALAPPLRDVAGFFRSIDHVARSGFRRAGLLGGHPPGPGASVRLDGWIEKARAAFLAGYVVGLGDPNWTLDQDLLRAFELEKELGEFTYAATFLPEWLYAPTGGLGALLGWSFQPVPIG